MNRLGIVNLLKRALQTAIGLLFLVASFRKLWEIEDFRQSIADFGIVYESMLPATAAAILIAEIFAGVGMIFNIRGGLLLTVVLLLLFTAVLSYGLWIGLDIDCGCFGIDVEWWTGAGLWPALWRNLILLLCCFALIVRRELRLPNEKQPSKGDLFS